MLRVASLEPKQIYCCLEQWIQNLNIKTGNVCFYIAHVSSPVGPLKALYTLHPGRLVHCSTNSTSLESILPMRFSTSNMFVMAKIGSCKCVVQNVIHTQLSQSNESSNTVIYIFVRS